MRLYSFFRITVPVCMVLLLVLGCTQSSTAQEPKLPDAVRHQLEAAVAKFMATNHVPGISVAVVEHAQLAWSAGFGMADLENSVPASAQTLYRLASISKSLTATGTMQLVERGKLDLDAPVQKYCPSFPEKEAPITTRLLLAHLAGIRHYRSDSSDDAEVGNIKHFDNPIEGGLQFFRNDPLIDKPGSKFHYSTQGYTLVGCAMQGASGQKYVDYMREHVFAPAGMTHTVVDDRYAIIPYRTRFYHKDKAGSVVNAEFLDASYKIPGGGWLSSADDMAQFEIAILTDKLMTRTTRDLMWTSRKETSEPDRQYGLGWGMSNPGFREVGHAGGQPGTSTFFMIAPDTADGVVVLANMDDVDTGQLATDLMKVVLGSATAPPKAN